MIKKKKVLVTVVCCVIFLGLAGLAASLAMRVPPDFAKLSDQQTLDYLKSGKAKYLDKDNLLKLGARLEQMRADTGLWRGGMSGVSEKERGNLRESRRLVSGVEMDKTINDFFALPANQQDAFLDKQIAQMDQRMQQFAARRPPPESAGPPSAGTGNASFRGRMRDPNARLQMRRNMLSRTTPEERAKRDEYFRRLMARRAATHSGAPSFGPGRR